MPKKDIDPTDLSRWLMEKAVEIRLPLPEPWMLMFLDDGSPPPFATSERFARTYLKTFLDWNRGKVKLMIEFDGVGTFRVWLGYKHVPKLFSSPSLYTEILAQDVIGQAEGGDLAYVICEALWRAITAFVDTPRPVGMRKEFVFTWTAPPPPW